MRSTAISNANLWLLFQMVMKRSRKKTLKTSSEKSMQSNRIHERNRIASEHKKSAGTEKNPARRENMSFEFIRQLNGICYSTYFCKNVKDKVRRTMNSMEYINRWMFRCSDGDFAKFIRNVWNPCETRMVLPSKANINQIHRFNWHTGNRLMVAEQVTVNRYDMMNI